MNKHFAVLTVLIALSFLTPHSSRVNSRDQKDQTSLERQQAAPERPDRTHTGVVAGTVVEDTNSPVSGATVMLQDTVTEEKPAATTTNGTGHYKFGSLLPGAYQVWATKGDRESEHVQVKVANGTIAEGNLVLRKAGAHM